MNIKITKCNNIDDGTIELKEKQLNIKYAINGTGKSTISNAIYFQTLDKNSGTSAELQKLTPFKYANQKGLNPDITGCEDITKVKVFDEKYLNDFIFLPNELLKGSFDIFICDENYIKGMQEIDSLIEIIKNELAQDKDVDDLIKDFNEISAAFGKPTAKGIHGSSAMSKAFKSGNKITNIPEGLEEYKDFIQDQNNFKWIKWQIDGNSFVDITENCPYCVSEIKDKKSKIKKVSEVYDSKAVENLNKIVSIFQRLNQYFTDNTNKIIDSFISNTNGYTDDQVNFLREIKDQIDRLYNKFVNAKNISFNSFKDVEKVIDSLNNHRIELNLFTHLNSTKTQEKTEIINTSLDKVIEKAGELQGSINKQKVHIEKLVKEHKKEINGFLRNAGFKYAVDMIEDEKGQLKLQLTHIDLQDIVSDVKTHLSFGEKNAFSLVLFMYDAIKSNPDLIILDDPISSFDKNKKYAIIDMLFRKGRYFDDKTVLLLTHDFEPIVDMVLHHSDKFSKPYATFLENENGILKENEINKTDIKTFIEINKENTSLEIPVINKLVYIRRLMEITKQKTMGYQLISNLLHKRETPHLTENGNKRNMTDIEIEEGVKEIRKLIPGFDYPDILSIVKSDAKLKEIYNNTDNNYEKLHIYRIIYDDKPDSIESDIIQKFINQAFHIENDYIYQLNPRDYQIVPKYIINECDKYVERLN